MTVLAIDPGRDQGWALVSPERVLLDCGLGEPPADLRPAKVVVERPQIYEGRKSQGARPKDIITLAIRVGRVTERWEARGCPVEHILPHEWKGSVDADTVLPRRILASLLDAERNLLNSRLARVAEGKRHNVIDAVGLAKWSLKRARAGVF